MKSIDNTERKSMSSAEKWGVYELRTSTGKNDLSASVLRIFALLKRVAAISNYNLGLLPQDVASHIIMATKDLVHDSDTLHQFMDLSFKNWAAAHEILNKQLTKHAAKIADSQGRKNVVVLLEEHVNLNQSSHDWFFSAIQIFLSLEIRGAIFPWAEKLVNAARRQGDGSVEQVRVPAGRLVQFDLGDWASQLAYATANLQAAVADFATLDLAVPGKEKSDDTKSDFCVNCVSRLAGSTGSSFSISQKSMSPAKRSDLLFKLSAALTEYSNTLLQITERIRWQINEECRRSEGSRGATSIEREAIEKWHSESRDFDTITACCIQILANDAAIAATGKRGSLEEAFSIFTMASYLLKSIGELVQVNFRLEKYLFQDDVPESVDLMRWARHH